MHTAAKNAEMEQKERKQRHCNPGFCLRFLIFAIKTKDWKKNLILESKWLIGTLALQSCLCWNCRQPGGHSHVYIWWKRTQERFNHTLNKLQVKIHVRFSQVLFLDRLKKKTNIPSTFHQQIARNKYKYMMIMIKIGIISSTDNSVVSR